MAALSLPAALRAGVEVLYHAREGYWYPAWLHYRFHF
jgi:hypothetical protein